MTLEKVLHAIVSRPPLHARWLNTLSYLENCGARKIANCEHRTLVNEEMLQHAAEEFRHAFLLKRQIPRIENSSLPDYSLSSLLGGFHALHYLDKLDCSICRFLHQQNVAQSIKSTAYLLVTYAIEVRASQLYPLYQSIIGSHGIKISLKALIAEEDRHLEEICKALSSISGRDSLMQQACKIEEDLFLNLIGFIENSMKMPLHYVSEDLESTIT